MNQDQMIVKELEGVLTHDPRIEIESCDLTMTSDAGSVTLAGRVPSVAAKRIAVRLAQGVAGVQKVTDELRVVAPNPMGDLEITDHIRHAFIQEGNLEENNIVIDTDPDGGVILRGQVRSLIQRRLAEVLCWWVPGVTDVRNLLVVNPAEQDNDDELKDNLITIMEMDSLVNPRNFKISVTDGEVRLSGRASSETERSAAEKDCWYSPGVVNVVNELRVS